MESKVEQLGLQKRVEDLLKEEKTQEEKLWRVSDREEAREGRQRFGKFESVINQEEGKKNVLKEKIEEPKKKVESTLPKKSEQYLNLCEEPPLPLPPLAPSSGEPVKEVIAMLRRKTKLPSQTFLRLVENYREVQHWEDHFPAGFRTRVGCQFLGEAPGTGKRCEAWTRDFIEIRELEEEIRKETERESLMKAKVKLDQYSGQAEQI